MLHSNKDSSGFLAGSAGAVSALDVRLDGNPNLIPNRQDGASHALADIFNSTPDNRDIRGYVILNDEAADAAQNFAVARLSMAVLVSEGRLSRR